MRKPFETSQFIEAAKEIHGNKYLYDKTVYVNAQTKVTITCLRHGDFFVRAAHHVISKSGCRKCAEEQRGLSYRKSQEQFNMECKKVFGERFDFSESVYKGDKVKVKVVCKKHNHAFHAIPSNLIRNKHGCAKCNASKGEEQIRQFLEAAQIEFVEQKRFKECKRIKPLPFDFYLPRHNLCIEFDGRQHFEPLSFGKDQTKETKQKNLVENQKRDLIKAKFCEEKNIKLLRIKFNEDISSRLYSLI